jgi:cell wall-associated NlpC family hydrolase
MAMKVIVLKVRHRENLDELDEVIKRRRTLEGGLGGWQMPRDAQPGDLVIWYGCGSSGVMQCEGF